MIFVRFAAPAKDWQNYEAPLNAALQEKGLKAMVSPDVAPDKADYLVYAPNDHTGDFSVFPKLKAVLSLWAGVERIVGNPTLQVPLARMVDDGLREGMTEWVVGHTLRYHLGMDRHVINHDHRWAPHSPPLARDRTVTILGLGQLGCAAGAALQTLGFNLVGWSRRPKTIAGFVSHTGQDGLKTALSQAQTLVLLLPDTAQTRNILNRETLAWLPKRAVILNPGRGTLIDDDALIEAVTSGHLAGATLDVFRTEPLPATHPFWNTQGITITPHIAAETRPGTASAVIADNIARMERGAPLLNVVDRDNGY